MHYEALLPTNPESGIAQYLIEWIITTHFPGAHQAGAQFLYEFSFLLFLVFCGDFLIKSFSSCLISRK